MRVCSLSDKMNGSTITVAISLASGERFFSLCSVPSSGSSSVRRQNARGSRVSERAIAGPADGSAAKPRRRFLQTHSAVRKPPRGHEAQSTLASSARRSAQRNAT